MSFSFYFGCLSAFDPQRFITSVKFLNKLILLIADRFQTRLPTARFTNVFFHWIGHALKYIIHITSVHNYSSNYKLHCTTVTCCVRHESVTKVRSPTSLHKRSVITPQKIYPNARIIFKKGAWVGVVFKITDSNLKSQIFVYNNNNNFFNVKQELY